MGLYPRKGALAAGSDADICVLDPADQRVIRAEDLHEADYTPWEGRKMEAWPCLTDAAWQGRGGKRRCGRAACPTASGSTARWRRRCSPARGCSGCSRNTAVIRESAQRRRRVLLRDETAGASSRQSRFGACAPRNDRGRVTMQLADQIALITGGSRGIGRATALAFAAEGRRHRLLPSRRRTESRHDRSRNHRTRPPRDASFAGCGGHRRDPRLRRRGRRRARPDRHPVQQRRHEHPQEIRRLHRSRIRPHRRGAPEGHVLHGAGGLSRRWSRAAAAASSTSPRSAA